MMKTKEIQGIKAVKELNGITLITLAIAIVVIIILAGVSINAIVGDDGLIKKAQESAELSNEAEAKETINRAILEFRLSKGYDTLKDFLDTKVTSGTIDSVVENYDGTLTISKNGYTMNVENKTKTSSKDDNDSGNDQKKDDAQQEGTITLSVTPYNGTYDGQVHAAITGVIVKPNDAKIEYSIDGTTYSTTMPTIINASSITVNIRASKTGYKTQTVTQTVKINKANGNLTLSETSGTSNYSQDLTFSVSENTGNLSVSSSNNDIATASISGNTVTVKPVSTGTATIAVTSAATTNYKAKTSTYTVTVNNLTFTVNSGVGYYADTDGDGAPDGIIIGDFKNGGSVSWGGRTYSIPTATALKEYFIVQTNYNGVFGTKPVLAAKGGGYARFDVMALNDYDYGNSTYQFEAAKVITSGEWKTATIKEWTMFAANLGITSSNFRKYELKNAYWSSTLNYSDRGDRIDFGYGDIAYQPPTYENYVRLARTF